MDLTRRTALAAIGSGVAVAATGEAISPTVAQQSTGAFPLHRTHSPRPLPFNPARLNGLSERLITSHWQNNYIGSVNALNMVETRLAAAMADPDFPPLIYGDMKREQLHRTGSVVLHEGSHACAGHRHPAARARHVRAQLSHRLWQRGGT